MYFFPREFEVMDIEKLKVPELRAELASRGLDTKGTKPVSFFCFNPSFEICVVTSFFLTGVSCSFKRTPWTSGL